MRTMIKVMKKGGKKIKDFIKYLKDDSLIVLFSFLSYTSIILLWWFQGMVYVGLYQGALNISTIFIGLGSEAILSTFMKERYKVNIDEETITEGK